MSAAGGERDLARLRALLFGSEVRRLAEAESRLAQLEAQLRASAEPKGDAALPEFAKKAENLEALKQAVDDAAAVGGGLWLSYLLALFYLMVAAGSVTHADLFFEKPINLLLLNVQLPIVAFFALAPLLFLALHAYTLAHLVMLTEKAKRFHKALYEQIGETASMPDEEKGKRKRIRDGLRAQLPSNVFVQFLAGPPELRDGGFGRALRVIGWSTLAFGPVLLFLLFQLQFLPYHSEFITWTHRLALLADLGLVWWLWRRILSGREPDERGSMRRRARFSWAWTPIGIAASFVVIVFSFALATYRGEPVASALARLDRAGVAVSLHDKIFHSAVSAETLRRRRLLSDTLVLPRVDALDELKIDDPERVKRNDYIFIAQDRDLAGAEFQGAILTRIDFSGAILTDANFSFEQKPGVSFEGAQLQGASLNGAQLQGASLSWVQLQGVSLIGAQLQGASLFGAQLQGASLFGAQLQGAFLANSNLQGANLADANLQAAVVVSAWLVGASLDYAQLRGASLQGAQLQGASFEGSELVATDLFDARFWRSTGAPHRLRDLRITPSQRKWAPFLMEDPGAPGEEGAIAWTKAAYDELRKQIETIPAGQLRDEALARIQVLGCDDAKLVSCDPDKAQNPPPEFAAWRDKLLAARVDDDVFRRALANSLHKLICPGDKDTLFVVRGGGFLDRLGAAGGEAKSLIADLSDQTSKTCPIAAQLTDEDRAKLAAVEAKVSAPAVPPPK